MSAIISPCGKYRYRLSRGISGKRVGFIGVNPSTADATQDDATVRKWAGFASRWGYVGFDVGNLFAYRSTDVKALAHVDDPIGVANDAHLKELMVTVDAIVPCWGDRNKLPKELHWRIDRVKQLITLTAVPVFIFGLTKSGDPKHPLMLGYDTQLTEWKL